MKLLKTIGISLLIAFAAGESAKAVAIDGGINFAGTAELNGALDVATAFNGFPFVTVASGTGDYAAVPSGTVATFPAGGFVFNPLPNPVSPLWSFTIDVPAVNTLYSFDLNSLTVVMQDPGFLMLSGEGVAMIDGFDDTAGSWSFVAVGGGSTFFGFSASSVVPSTNTNSVPEGGATAAMLGFSLIGFASLRRKLGVTA